MDNQANGTVSNFVANEILKMENRLFWAKLLVASIGYLLITSWLNSIRVTASLWFVWVLIIIQFALYFSIFISSYGRSKALGLNKNFAFIIFVILAILGRVNNWELLIIPILVVIMLVSSARNKLPKTA